MTRKTAAELLDSALDDTPESKTPATVDQSHIVLGQWPGNPPQRTGNFYFDLNRLTLAPGQKGLMGVLAENFVYERVDLHVIRPTDEDVQIELSADSGQLLDGFLIKSGGKTVLRQEPTVIKKNLCRVSEGCFMGRQPVYLTLHSNPPKQGRVVINFIGYLIEPWR